MSGERSWLQTAVPILSGLAVLATVVTIVRLDDPALGFAVALIISALIVGLVGRRIPGPALIIGFGLDVLLLGAAFVASFAQIGHTDCGTSCTEQQAAFDAGHGPFIEIGLAVLLLRILLVIAAGVVRLARRALRGP